VPASPVSFEQYRGMEMKDTIDSQKRRKVYNMNIESMVMDAVVI
jgi:hypothetical protein